MKRIFSKYIDKLFVRQWIIGLTRGNVKEIIRSKTFDPDITWLPIKSINRAYADPFIFKTTDWNYDILFEDYSFKEEYGKIGVMSVDENFKPIDHKIVLDTKSHLSYPFVFIENDKIYVIPEAAQSGKLSCYEYDPVHKSLVFLQQLIDKPLLDATILKHNNKYWLFGILREKGVKNEYKLCVFFSNTLLGPYSPHPKNPLKNSLNGTRSAGNFIEVDGVIYRPTQNCKKTYGESIAINKIKVLNEFDIVEEFHMSISINKKNKNNYGMHTIHAINFMDDIIVVDGIKSRFSPISKLKRKFGKIDFFRMNKKMHVKKHLIVLKILVDMAAFFYEGV
jgi:hypothetical protein